MAKYDPSTLTGDLTPVNAELQKIAAAINDQLDRLPGTSVSNNMTAELDMNSNKIINLAAPVDPNDGARKADVDAIVTGAGLIDGSTGSTDNALLRADGTGGNTLQASSVILDDTDSLTGILNLTATGSVGGATLVGTVTTASQPQVDHDSLLNYVANEHIDWTSTSSAFSTTGTAATGQLSVTGNILVTGTVDGRDIAADGSTLDTLNSTALVDGDFTVNGLMVRTASGTYTNRSVVDAGSSRVTVTNGDGVSGNVTLDVNQGSVDHDALLNFVANEHIDWTNTTQNLSTTGTGAFATVNTGQGANELYAMDQNVRTSDSVTFDGLTSTDAMTLQEASGNSQFFIQTSDTTSRSQLIFGDSADSNVGGIQYDHSTDTLEIHAANMGARYSIDSSGNHDFTGTLTTSSNIQSNAARVAFGVAVDTNIRLLAQGIGSTSGTSSFTAKNGAGNTALDITDDLISTFGNDVDPDTDNAHDFGNASFRWAELFAANGTINTSDETLKTDFERLSDIEKEAFLAAGSLIGKYKWLDAVDTKGDDARIHIGVPAQTVMAEFTSRGLDPTKYACFCIDDVEVWDTVEVTELVQKTETKTRDKIHVEIVDGIPTRKITQEEYQSPVFDMVGLVDVNGNAIMEPVESGKLDEEKNPIIVEQQVMYPVPVMKETKVKKKIKKPAGQRYGVRYNELFAGIIASRT